MKLLGLGKTQDNTRSEIQENDMAGSGWSCPHELDGLCNKVNNLPCDPGMKGCELYGRYVFYDESKNERLRQKQSALAAKPENNTEPT